MDLFYLLCSRGKTTYIEGTNLVKHTGVGKWKKGFKTQPPLASGLRVVTKN